MSYQTRDANWVIGKAWSEAKGKSPAPTTGNKYNQLLVLVDTELKNWESEEGVEWDSLWSRVTLANLVTATDTFPLPTSVKYISKRSGDSIYLQSADGTQKQAVTLVRPNQLYDYKDNAYYAAQIGRNLVFSRPFVATDSVIGYSIIVPSYGYTNDITAGTDIVNCDAPLYIAYMVAASYARNDLIKMGQYDNLLEKATALMNKMKQNNSGQLEELPRESFITNEVY